MANIALNKPSGGQLILSPEDGTSTETVTIPSGGVMAADAPTGKVLQVQNFVTGTTASVANTTYVNTPLTINITPTSSSSKLLVFATVNGTASSTAGYFRLQRNGTTIGSSSEGSQDTFSGLMYNSGGSSMQHTTINYEDSPSTTSQVTYTIQFRSQNTGTFYFNRDQNGTSAATSTITVMEVAA